MNTPQAEGEFSLQSPQITSSSELYSHPFTSKYTIRGRTSIRRSDRRVNIIVYNVTPEYPTAPNPNLNNTRAQITDNISTKYATLSVILIFLVSLSALYVVYQTFPEVTNDERQHMKIPWNIEDAKQLGIVLNRYKGDHYYHVMAGVFLTYIFLQTFAIPGSLFLSILSGYLFPFYVALILVCTCSMVGATLCFYYLSCWVDKHKDDMLNYIIFLRITPVLPNWFINLTAPVLGVPLMPFAIGTFIGVAPPSFFAIQGGQTLQTMTVENSAFNMNSLMWLLAFAVISIIPIFLRNRV